MACAVSDTANRWYSHGCRRSLHEAVDHDTLCKSGTAVPEEHMAIGEYWIGLGGMLHQMTKDI
jgi:hypothetical protein